MLMFEYGITRNSLPLIEHDGIFDRVIVIPHMRGGSTISWWLDAKRFKATGPYTFYVEWAEHPDADFEQAAGPTFDNVLVDPVRRRFSKLPHSVYRVRINTPSGDYYSSPHLCMGNWNRHDYLLARDMVRREYLSLIRYTGTRGMYLARKQWGELCTSCTDYQTDTVTNSHCKVCYGTGLVGGYHAPSQLYVGEDRTSVRSQRTDGIGVVNDQVQVARAVACPFLTAKDVWINISTDERWSIENKQELVTLRGIPLVYGVELRLIEPSSIIYTISLEDTGSSSS